MPYLIKPRGIMLLFLIKPRGIIVYALLEQTD